MLSELGLATTSTALLEHISRQAQRLDAGIENRMIEGVVSSLDSIHDLMYQICDPRIITVLEWDAIRGIYERNIHEIRPGHDSAWNNLRNMDKLILIKYKDRIVGFSSFHLDEYDGLATSPYHGASIEDLHKEGRILVQENGAGAIDQEYRDKGWYSFARRLGAALSDADLQFSITKREKIVSSARRTADMMDYAFYPGDAPPRWLRHMIIQKWGERCESIDFGRMMARNYFISADSDFGEGHDGALVYAVRQPVQIEKILGRGPAYSWQNGDAAPGWCGE